VLNSPTDPVPRHIYTLTNVGPSSLGSTGEDTKVRKFWSFSSRNSRAGGERRIQ
jgi:hypothetical protein